MLGLGLNITKTSILSSEQFLPSNISSIKNWWRFQTGLENTLGETDYTQFSDLDVLLRWDDQVGSVNCINNQNFKRPKWSLANTACIFLGNRHWDLTSNIVIAGDFTWSFRVRLSSLAGEGFLGQNNANYFEITNSNTFTADIGGFIPDNVFTDASSLSTGIWYTVHFVRSGSNLNVYVDGGAFTDKQWGGTATETDPFTVAGIGSWGDATQEFNGIMKDVSVFNEALSTSDRGKMNTYLASL